MSTQHSNRSAVYSKAARPSRAKMETFRAPAPKADGLRVSGVAITYWSPVDSASGPTVMAPTVFKQSIKQRGDKVKFLWNHDPAEPRGRVLSFEDKADGLHFVAELDNTTASRELLTQMKSGTVDGLSVGWDPIKVEMVKPEALIGMGAPDSTVQHFLKAGVREVRVGREGRLWEVSACVWGADPRALVQRVGFVRGERERVMRLRIAAIDAAFLGLDLSQSIK